MDEAEPCTRENSAAQRLLWSATTEIVPARQRMFDLSAVHHDRRILPQHRKQLDDTRTLISRAQTDGHTRLAEMNHTVETNLLTIIATLETDQRDCRCAAAGSETCCGKEPSDAP
ncbi:hypothetical protein [Mycobacterium kubicae]|uniref:hypothetical protein n=1 Tax=Mycobacterium kubicae TaxID=120959 RepID=UPI0021B318C9|nr:hypothetical protein [Mycobacterium kubicae]